jgi:ABC-type antimicrobial peptide transport system permease subunit
MALGAASQDVIFMILRQVSRNVLLGLAVGLCASLCFTWMLASLLFGVESTDLSTIAAVTALICLVALAASYVPALRAAKLVPVSAMRVES